MGINLLFLSNCVILEIMKFESKIVPELIENNKITPELIKSIEESKLNSDDKMNILLTKSGFKPASEINLIIKTKCEGETNEHMNEEEIREVLNFIKKLGLLFKLGKREIRKETYQKEEEPGIEKFYLREQMEILIGRSKEDLDLLVQALQTKSDELLGKAFGFPQTAIEAFVGKRKKLDISTLPKEVRKSDAMLFSSPTLSEDNWQEEVEQGQRKADFIKKISPIIYEELKELHLRSRNDLKEDLR